MTNTALEAELKRNAAPFNLKVAGDIPHITGSDFAANRGRIIRLYAGLTRVVHFYSVFGYIWLPTGSSWRPHIHSVIGCCFEGAELDESRLNCSSVFRPAHFV